MRISIGLLLAALAVGCGEGPLSPAPKPLFEDGPLEHVVLEHHPAARSGIGSGVFEDHALVYDTIAVDSVYRHALTFQMTPMLPPLREAAPTSGPLILHGDDREVMILSPLDHFFESLITFDGERIAYGLEGEIDAVPPDFSHRFILVTGTGMARTIAYWGERLHADRGREPIDRYADAGLAYLGYWTDNGASYYYETAPNMNEADTLSAVAADAATRGIPLGYMQLDSWWYFKEGSGGPQTVGGLVEWKPQPHMFPDGLAAFQADIGMPLILHNRWFAKDNAYLQDHDFVEGDEMALPADRDVYEIFMRDAMSWGAITYEQDWLMTQFWGVPHLRNGIGHAATWLGGIDRAAGDAGLTVQLTMPGPAHLMDALDRPSVTSIRTSIDYHAGISKESFWPQFHTVNMLAAAAGVSPFKDTFRSTEPFGEAEALVSILSAGMVGPSDAIGEMSASLLLRTCRSDGLLLKPDAPAVPIDAMFLEHARPYTTLAYSDRPGVGRWTYLAAYHLASDHPDHTAAHEVFALVSYDGVRTDQMVVVPPRVEDYSVSFGQDLRRDEPAVVYDWRRGVAHLSYGGFDIAPMSALYDHAYFVIVPVLDNGLALIGETDKFVTMADRRFSALAVVGDELVVGLAGAPGEQVRLRTFDARLEAMLPDATATIAADGRATLTIAR